jgi:hypothetical protein
LYFFSRAKNAVICGPGEYQVVKCGASGHNVRSRPSLKAPPVGMLVLGNHVTVLDHVSYQCIFSEFCVCCVRFEGFTAVTMKNVVFWDI